jgi:uncharacterized membrane protein (UPF0127 family)
MKLRISNHRTGKPIATRVTIAVHFWQRVRGLIGRHRLEDREALVIPRCNSIHTFFMNFPIDVLFIRGGRVAAVRESLKPFRVATVRGRGMHVVELAPGSLRRSDTRSGDRIQWERV